MNKEMLAINEKMGFVKQPAWIYFTKEIPENAEKSERTERNARLQEEKKMDQMTQVTDNSTERIRNVENSLLAEGFTASKVWRRVSLPERMEYFKTPGVSIAVIDNGEIAWAKGYGVRLQGTPDPVTTRTLFQADSISKPVAAMAALRLVQEGRIGLDEDVNRYLTSWKVPANEGWQPVITLRQLLSHTAGLTVHGFPGYAPGTEIPTTVQVLDGEPPCNTHPVRVNMLPGSSHRYSGGGTTIVQQMLVDVVGKPFPHLVRELVLEPLGMNDSTYEQPLPTSRKLQAATAHPSLAKPIEGGAHIYPEMAAAGLWTTANDLARFALEIQLSRTGQSNKVLSQAMVEEMLSPQVESRVGLGVFIENRETAPRFGHGGWDEGFVATMTAFFEGGKGAVVMVNSNQGWPLLDEILRSIGREYGWVGFEERSIVATSPAIGEATLGTFQLRPDYLVTLHQSGDELLLSVPGQMPVRLFPTVETTLGTTFFATALDAEVSVTVSDNGAPINIVLRQSGRSFPLKRI